MTIELSTRFWSLVYTCRKFAQTFLPIPRDIGKLLTWKKFLRPTFFLVSITQRHLFSNLLCKDQRRGLYYLYLLFPISEAEARWMLSDQKFNFVVRHFPFCVPFCIVCNRNLCPPGLKCANMPSSWILKARAVAKKLEHILINLFMFVYVYVDLPYICSDGQKEYGNLQEQRRCRCRLLARPATSATSHQVHQPHNCLRFSFVLFTLDATG